MVEAFDRLASAPPSELAGRAVTRLTDYRVGGEHRARWLGEASLLELELGESARALVRPSGTEPKLKIYVDLRTAVPADGAVPRDAAIAEARAVAEALTGALAI